MAISFNEELIRVEYVIGEDTISETVTGEVVIPDTKPDVERVVEVTADIMEIETEIEDGGVNITGNIETGVIYVADVPEGEPQQPVHFSEGEITFTNFVDIPQAQEGMNVFTDLNIKRVSYELLDNRTIEITVVITKFVKVTEYRQITVITEVTGIDEEDISQELLRIEDVIGENTVTTVISGRIEVPAGKPPIERVLNAGAEILPTTAEITEEGVIIDGQIEAGVIYVAQVPEGEPQQPVHFLEGEISFSEAIEVAGALPEYSVYTNAFIKRVSYDFISESVVEVDVTIEFFAKVTEPKQVNVITDIISDQIELERELLRVEDVVGEDIVYETVTGRINIPVGKPDLERVLEATAQIMEVNSFTESGGVMIEGTIESSILYVGVAEEGEPQQPVHFSEGIINFDNFVDIPGTEEGMNTHTEVTVQNVSYEELNARTVELTVVLKKFAKVTEFRQLEIITDIIVISPAADECPPSYVIYVVQHGDTFWRIAKRYNTTVDKLIQANPDVDPDNLQVGQKICIPSGIIEPKG